MATRIVVTTTTTDDIDGTEGAQSFKFSLNGEHYEIDLAERHAGILVESLQPYMKHGRKVVKRGRPRKDAAKEAATSLDGRASPGAPKRPKMFLFQDATGRPRQRHPSGEVLTAYDEAVKNGTFNPKTGVYSG